MGRRVGLAGYWFSGRRYPATHPGVAGVRAGQRRDPLGRANYSKPALAELALDMTNFAIFIDTSTPQPPSPVTAGPRSCPTPLGETGPMSPISLPSSTRSPTAMRRWTVRAGLEDALFGKHILVTDHHASPAANVVVAYRPQSEAEAGFHQLKNTQPISFAPMLQ